ncbi:MAG: tRNA pseudouridine synthase B [Candidatus Methanoperedenaceae archaeon GB50]|nr:MAG: tRNA pseudouridine synthase B [Candidatus Methanoperedenaceae archaeon GB50]CAD7779582.1 tRNA pseudouridine synthase B [Candidatus Methanoperedenaceae archaeon GB50]CAD7780871.1 tRNA pseudouridine synthase B [Candidatus Methanoperedenaceae archaeon GB37]
MKNYLPASRELKPKIRMKEISGIFVIDKPGGITSFEIVRRIKTWLNLKKVGHGGTLDPLATGVLPIFINKATKIAQFFLNMDKTYMATMRLGLETETMDIEGETTRVCKKIDVSIEELQMVMRGFQGKITQIPPSYSSLKVGGVPLYKWARKGIKIQPAPREVEIYELKLKSFRPPEVDFEVSCSKGTYIRTLCSDIGKKLGCGACLVSLRRLKTGPFTIEMAIPLEVLKEAVKAGKWQDYLLDLNKALASFEAVVLNKKQEEQVKHGRFIRWPYKLTRPLIRALNKENQLVALLQTQETQKGMQLRPVKVFDI